MRVTRRAALWFGAAPAAVATAGAVLLYTGVATGGGDLASGRGTVTGGGAAKPELRVASGPVPAPGLLPGEWTVLPVTLEHIGRNGRNDKGVLTLTSVEVRVDDASPECPAGAVEVIDYRSAEAGAPQYRIAAGARVDLSLPIVLRETGAAQDACRGTHFPLRVTATAQAGR